MIGSGRKALVRAGLVAAGLGALAIPPLAVGLSGSAAADGLWTALRLGALWAVTLLFANIVTGAFRPWFGRLFRPRAVHRFHHAVGLTGFALAVAHGVMAAVFGIVGYAIAPVWLGPLALALLALAIAAALLRTRWRRRWRWIHRVNYLVFFIVLTHGLVIGADLGREPLLRVWGGLYAAVALAGLIYRLWPRASKAAAQRTV